MGSNWESSHDLDGKSDSHNALDEKYLIFKIGGYSGGPSCSIGVLSHAIMLHAQ